MSLPRPSAALTVDGQELSAPEAGLSSLRVDIGSAGAHDALIVDLSELSPLAGAAPGADAEIALGFDDDVETVLTGSVAGVERQPWGFRLEVLAESAVLSHARIGKSYVQQTVADIVSDLISSGGASAGAVDSSVELGAYHVDERKTVWAHICGLGRLTDSELSSDPTGEVNFRPLKSGFFADHALRYGAELLRWDVVAAEPPEPVRGVAPIGAGSEEGADKWHILLNDAGGGDPVIIPPAVRSRDAASAVAEGRKAAAARRAGRGTVTATGLASARPGDLADLTGLPGAGDVTVRIARVFHRFDHAGFATALHVEGAP